MSSILLFTDGEGKVLSNQTEANQVGSDFLPRPITPVEVCGGLDKHDVIGRVLKYKYLGAGQPSIAIRLHLGYLGRLLSSSSRS